ncbi:LysR family transcriptional regulator [Kitasatospora sp. NPDC085895]|uniref:LysR family transcriptional regulator n=1 Tax=Kitasatospora sp. NPDC085895 TaxID=3155057 RepID=UPI00344E6B6C
MDIDTRLLRAFAAVFDEGQLTAAASRLGVAQPTLTKRIRLLEGQLEVRLFERSRAGMAPTPAAHELAARVPALLAGWADALTAARAAAGRPAVLRVGFESGTIHLVGLATVEAFARRMPGWQVRLRQFNGFDSGAALDAGEIDLALWHAPPEEGGEGGATADGRYGCAPLGLDERWVVLPAGHRLADRGELAMADLLDEAVVPVPAVAGFWRDHWIGADARGGRPVRVGAVVHSPDEWLAAVACGQGIGFAPASLGALAGRPDVVFRPVRGLGPSRAGLYWPAGRPPTAAAEAFVLSCRETVAAGGRVRPPAGAVDQTASNGAG